MHPSQLYVDEPMLCQFVWQKEQDAEIIERERAKQANIQAESDAVAAAVAAAADATASKEINADLENGHDQSSIHAHIMEQDNTTSTNENDDPNANANANANPNDEPVESKNQEQEYKNYNKSYCLRYVRSFFNQHLDDAWFRERYSPLAYKRKVSQQRERAALEAHAILNEVKSQDAVSTTAEGSGVSVSGGGSSVSGVHPFVVHARLGGGVKPNSNSNDQGRDGRDHAAAGRKRKYSASSETPHFDAVQASGLPKSHLSSFLQENTAMHIMDVPSHVTDEQLSLALKEHAGADASLFPVQIMSGIVVPGVCSAVAATNNDMSADADADADGLDNNNNNNNHSHHDSHKSFKRDKVNVNDAYHRDAWAIFENGAAKEKVMDNLIRSYMESEGGRHARDSRSVPKVIELSVDCTDPYGRYDIDADGKGGAPLSSSGDAVADGDADQDDHVSRIPVTVRRVPVFISSSLPIKSQSATVLSAAVSSATRIKSDKEAAISIARKLDVKQDIPREARLESILKKLFTSDAADASASASEDMLDVAIAYLRRVHLFTFYNGCTAADNVGCALSGNHPTSVIHLRLKGADEILKKAREDNADMYDDLPINDGDDSTAKDSVITGEEIKSDEPKDMLVMRLDDSIAKALENLCDLDVASPFIVNETVDALASEIESLEEKTKREWIDNHAVIDDDGRARCSLHFCRKLFKDETFLNKHLVKKHGEHLRAEMAKCHDRYMMQWWDEEVHRPVPQVRVDCGSKFGLIPNSVLGAAEPCVTDPEPELWREEQERIRKQEEEDERYREKKAAVAEFAERKRKHSDAGDGNRGTGDGSFENSNFVDVDDMKDEKVELSFSNIEVSQPPTKKGRKKKKKLL